MPSFRDLPSTLLLSGLFAVIFLSRAWLVHVWGSPVPYWDQWDAEAWSLYRHWLDGTWRMEMLFSPHNEHRIALTRLLDLGIFALLGRWDTWVLMLVNAALHAACACALLRHFWPALAPATRACLTLGLAVLFSSTYGWENALWGFQSQFYLANLLAVVALGLLAGTRILSARWWLGALAAWLALFANATGLLTVLLALVVTVLSIPGHGESRRNAWIGLGVLTLLMVLAFALKTEVAHHAPLRASGFAQFWPVFSRSLSWPHVNSEWWWILMHAPALWLMIDLVRRRTWPDKARCLALALAALSVLLAAAIAYSRGGGLLNLRPPSRYQDTLALGAIANFAIVLMAVQRGRSGRMAAVAWSALVLAGLITLATTNFTVHLRYKRAQDGGSLLLVRDYLENRNPAVFHDHPLYDGPHPEPQSVIRVLEEPALRAVLPPELRGHADSKPWPIRHSPWLTVTAWAALALMLARTLRTRPDIQTGE